MSDDPIRDALDARSERGQVRGGDQVWTDATAEPSYVSPAPPPRTPWPIVAGAAAAALLLVGGIVGGVALVGSDDDDEVAMAGDQPGDAPAMCLLELEDENANLGEWVERVGLISGISEVESLSVPDGARAGLQVFGREPLELPHVSRGIAFAAFPGRAAVESTKADGAGEVTCLSLPDWAWVPGEPASGTEVMIVSFDPDHPVPVHDEWEEILEMPGVLTAEPFDQQRSYEEFRELFAQEPEMVEAVSPDILTPSVRIVADRDEVEELQERLEAMPGAFRVVVPDLMSATTEFEQEPKVMSTTTEGEPSGDTIVGER